jgi:hypothetical protein
LLEIANQDPDVALCNQAALDGALTLDRMEDEDAHVSRDRSSCSSAIFMSERSNPLFSG